MQAYGEDLDVDGFDLDYSVNPKLVDKHSGTVNLRPFTCIIHFQIAMLLSD